MRMFTLRKPASGRLLSSLMALAAVSVALLSCEPTPSGPVCAFGEPRPIFTDSMGPVVEHTFNAIGQEASEEVLFSNGQKVMIFQQGCDTLIQEFRFPLPAEPNPVSPRYRATQAMEQFAYLAGVDPKLNSLSLWTVQLTAGRDTLPLGQPLPLGQGLSIALDAISGDTEDMLIVTLQGAAPSK